MPAKKTLKRQLNWYVTQFLMITRYCLISGECILIFVSSCIFNQAYRKVIVPPVWLFQWLCQSKTFIQISNLLLQLSKLFTVYLLTLIYFKAGEIMPPKSRDTKRIRAMEVTDDLKNFKAFNAIRQSRAVARLWGIRAKKAREAEADDLSKPKK